MKKALERNGIKYNIKEKEGAFYGPKIDGDVIGFNEWKVAMPYYTT